MEQFIASEKNKVISKQQHYIHTKTKERKRRNERMIGNEKGGSVCVCVGGGGGRSCLSHTSCVLLCSLFSCLSANMGNIIISCDSGVVEHQRTK